jgi:tetratricopeptide (TPR) repeat protein
MAKQHYEETLSLARSAEDPTLLSQAAYNLAWTLMVELSDPPRATRLLQEAVELSRHSGDQTRLAGALAGLANALQIERRDPEALEASTEGIEVARVVGERYWLGWSLRMAAVAWTRMAQPDAARGAFGEALRIFKEAGDLSALTILLVDIAELAQLLHQADVAVRLEAASQTLREHFGFALGNQADVIRDFSPGEGLHADAMAAARREGAAMSSDQAMDYAFATVLRETA